MKNALFLLSLLTATTLAAPMAMAKTPVKVGAVHTLRAPSIGPKVGAMKKHSARIKKARGHRRAKKSRAKSKVTQNGQSLPPRMPNGRFGKKG